MLVRLGGQCHRHKFDTNNTVGKEKNAHFHFMEAEIASKRKDFLPKNADAQHSGEGGVPSPSPVVHG